MASGSAIHDPGVTALIPFTTIATFRIGTFLENIAARSDGTLLISSMISGEIFLLRPQRPKTPQSTLLTLHTFNPSPNLQPSSEETAYGSNNVAEALVEDPNTPDIFYTFSGFHGKAGTWSIYRLDLRAFNPSCHPTISVQKLANVPHALWLNGGTMFPPGILLMAESRLGQVVAYNLHTNTVSIWLEHPLLGKVTTPPEWPAINGIQHFRGAVFATSSDRGIVLRMDADPLTGAYILDSITTVAENLTGDDLAFDEQGNAYIATNPAQSVMKVSGLGIAEEAGEKATIIGGEGIQETAGPTAVAFGRGEGDRAYIYVTTTGGIVRAVGEGVGFARVVRAVVGVRVTTTYRGLEYYSDWTDLKRAHQPHNAWGNLGATL
ncbi:hypothetical protein LSUB1_G007148 [Lachnellula subtilissima]|uniref:SMP-30/Gluconolactonase/LRE-like region domain-containing protein n=1 Tax=Lachnellula subtilissima TaxID=602034 RepID=A0A8H8U4U3_9HELO|nr:hypothetical protein LSUB1_G007148 [Lachnellula subtilissima]